MGGLAKIVVAAAVAACCAGAASAQGARDVLVLEVNSDALRAEVMRIAQREASEAAFKDPPEEISDMEIDAEGKMQLRTLKLADLPANHPARTRKPSHSVGIVGDTLEVALAGSDDTARALDTLGRALPGFELSLRIDAKAIATLTPDGFMQRMNSAVEVSRNVLVRRLEAAGVVGTTVERNGARLKVSGPAGVITDDVVELMQARGAVSFHRVVDAQNADDFATPGVTKGAFRTLPNVSMDGALQIIDVRPIISSGEIAAASAGFDDYGQANIAFTLTEGGRTKFAEATRSMLGQAFAIVLDETLMSVPVVQSEITGGQGQITGLFTAEEAGALAARMAGGTLPVRLELVERRIDPAE